MGVRPRMTLRLAGVAACGGLLLRDTPTFGQVPPLPPAIVLLMADDDPTARRVAAEIRAAGLELRAVESPPGSHNVSDVDLQSRLTNAARAVDLDPARRAVRIWAVDRSKGQVVLQSVVPLNRDPAVVALQVVEALRASLSLASGSASPAPAHPSEPAEIARAAPPAGPEPIGKTHAAGVPRLGAAFGPAFGWGGGPFEGSWEGLVSAYWLWAPPWGVEVVGAFPLTTSHRVVAAGTATLAFGLAGSGVHARALAANWCFLDFGAGVGAGAIRTQGLPNAGYAGMLATTWVATPYARMAYAFSITSVFWLQADVTSGVAVPRPNFTFAGERATWGVPLVLASVGVQVGLR
jgi:hypothetical protein